LADVRHGVEQRLAELGEFIREQRETASLSIRRLADLAGVSNPYLSQIERGLRNPSAESLRKIAHALRLSAESLYVRAGILDGADRPSVADAIAADPQLTADQKHTLLTVYESFRGQHGRTTARESTADENG
jgi:transcriptional regulator with XRE-family HTH domain